MSVMAKEATNRVSTLKLPNGQLTETGKGTLEELFRVHFPDSKPVDKSRDKRQGQQTWTGAIAPRTGQTRTWSSA
jgi:hypothetical protein